MMDTNEHWNGFIGRVLNDEASQYLWLRSLSYLEYIGYRKMVKSLGYQEVNREVFHHLSDEIRHSYLLKELAEKSFEGRFRNVPFDSAYVDITENYFQDVDQSIDQWVYQTSGEKRPFLCYLLTSYLIEKRAMKVYPSYYAKLEEASAKVVFQKIIKDERDHLSYLEERLSHLPERENFLASSVWQYEDKRFTTFLDEFENSVSGTKDH